MNCGICTCGFDASCRLLWRVPPMVARVSRRHFTQEPLRSDDDDRLFNPLAPVVLSSSTLLPTIFLEKGHREEGEAKTQGEGEEGGALIVFVVVLIFLRWPMASIPATRSPAPSHVVCRWYATSSSGGGIFQRHPHSSIPAFCLTAIMVIPVWWLGCRHRVPEHGLPVRGALGR